MTTKPHRASRGGLSPAEIEEIWAAAAQEIKNAPPATAQQLAIVEMAVGPALRASYAATPHLDDEGSSTT